MTQKSFPWSSTGVGDGHAYTYVELAAIWNMIYNRGQANAGILPGVRNEYAVTGSTSPLSVAGGGAVVNGTYAESDASESVTVATPSGATRIDRIVLQKLDSTQTVRLVLLQGVEGSGTPPTITQIQGTKWEIPIFKVTITTGGSITLADERIFVKPAFTDEFPFYGNGGRLTLLSGDPSPEPDQTAKTQVFFTPWYASPFAGVIGIFDGSRWVPREFSELSVNVPSNTNTPFDIFANWNGSSVALSAVAWSSDTGRSVAISKQNNKWVKSTDATYRLLGTGRTTSVSGQIEDSRARRYLANVENRVPRNIQARIANWTTAASALQEVSAGSTPGVSRIECVVPIGDVSVYADGIAAFASIGDIRNYLFFSINGVALNAESFNVANGANPATCMINTVMVAVGLNSLRLCEKTFSAGGWVSATPADTPYDKNGFTGSVHL